MSINENFKKIKVIDENYSDFGQEYGMSVDFNGKCFIIKSLFSKKND